MRLCHQLLLLVLHVDEAPVEDHATGESNIIELVDPRFVESLSTEDGVEAEVVLDNHVEHILVEVVAD